MEETHTPHIVMVPTPGMGHLIPLTELARRLTELNFSITFLIPNDGSPPTKSQLSLFQNLSNSISHLFLSPVDVTDISPDTAIETRIILTLTRSIPALRDSLRVLTESTRLVALVVDLFGFPVLDLAKEYGILPYMFSLGSAFSRCFGFSLPKLDKMYTCEYRDLPEPVQLFPGSVPVHGVDFIDPVQDRQDEVYKEILNMAGTYHRAAGILVNSFIDLEPAAFKYLMEDCPRENNTPPVFPIGPVVQTGLRDEFDGSVCLKWLDEQPSGSVLYVSFGSGGTLSHVQLVELAIGLELSGIRFLWVVKSPHDKVANASYFSVDNYPSDPLQYLPKGFLERTKGLGLVVPSWAPQIQILSHKSVGGFLTHCGWNSVLESIVNGVPFIAWPLFAEQRLNAVLLAEDLKVAIRVKPNENVLVQRDQVAQCVVCLIQGDEGKVLRGRMNDLKHKANAALSENGSSRQYLVKVAQLWLNHKSKKIGLGATI